MKKTESTLLNMTLVMVVVALITAGLLAFVNNITEKPIEEQKQKTIAEGIYKVMGSQQVSVVKTDTMSNEGEKNIIVHIISDNKGNNCGAAIESETQGFGGTLRILTGFDNDGNILGYTILQSAETPGLGAKADTWFQKDGKGCIVGKNPASTRMGVTKGNEGDIDAITASTITSRAFLKAVQQAYEMIKQK